MPVCWIGCYEVVDTSTSKKNMVFDRIELQQPPVREVITGFVFEPVLAYSLVCGALQAQIGDRFPEFEENPNGVRWSPSSAGPTGPLARLSNERYVLQVGRGSIGVNQVGAYDFPDFLDTTLEVLSVCKRLGIMDAIRSAALRYVNFFSDDLLAGLNDPFRVSARADGLPITLRDMTVEFGDPAVSIYFKYGASIDDKSGVVMDLDIGTDTLDDSEAWLRTSHDQIYQAFRSCVSDELFQRLKGNS